MLERSTTSIQPSGGQAHFAGGSASHASSPVSDCRQPSVMQLLGQVGSELHQSAKFGDVVAPLAERRMKKYRR
jgi:hypothetical protein